MSIVEKYKRYRQAGIVLNKKIGERTFPYVVLDDVVNMLGLDRQGKTILFDSEFEMDVMNDFITFEYIYNKQRLVDKFKEEFSPDNDREKEILKALVNSRTSLFVIVGVDVEDSVIWLSDIFGGEQNIRLVDVGLSMSAEVGFIMFTRLISFEDFSMTSGVSFVFKPDLKSYICRRYKKIMKKFKGENELQKRFVAFFKLSKECGLEIMNK